MCDANGLQNISQLKSISNIYFSIINSIANPKLPIIILCHLVVDRELDSRYIYKYREPM